MYQWYLHWYHWKEECLLFHFIIVKNPFHNYPGFVLKAKSAIFTAKCPARAYLVRFYSYNIHKRWHVWLQSLSKVINPLTLPDFT